MFIQDSLKENNNYAYELNTEELKIELDEMVKENSIKPYLNSMFVDSVMDEDKLDAVIIENKSGRFAIKADIFIYASGGALLARRSGYKCYEYDSVQPPTMCAKIYGIDTLCGADWRKLIQDNRQEFGLDEDW